MVNQQNFLHRPVYWVKLIYCIYLRFNPISSILILFIILNAYPTRRRRPSRFLTKMLCAHQHYKQRQAGAQVNEIIGRTPPLQRVTKWKNNGQ